MKNKNHKIKDASKAGLGLIVTSLLEVGTDTGAELVKDTFTHVASDFTTDVLSSVIPGVGGAVSSYKRMRTERNLKHFAEELYKRSTVLIDNLQKQTEETRAKLDELLFYILEITIEEHQVEKITFMVNGYLNLTTHEDFTTDFVMHYYDMLKQLRLVDISVLRLYNQTLYMDQSRDSRQTFDDIMKKHGITYEQYNSVRETLIRYGLLELDVKEDTEDDMSKLEKSM